MLDEKVMTAAPAPVAFRGENGAVREEYVDRVTQAIEAADSAMLRELVGDLHEADGARF
jgi:magnesium transporter